MSSTPPPSYTQLSTARQCMAPKVYSRTQYMVVYDGDWEVNNKKTIEKKKGKMIVVDKDNKKEKKVKGTWILGKPGRPPNWYKYGLEWNGK